MRSCNQKHKAGLYLPYVFVWVEPNDRRSWGDEAKRVLWTKQRAEEVAEVEKIEQRVAKILSGNRNRAMKNPTPTHFLRQKGLFFALF